MAAVLALVMVPLFAALGFFALVTHSDGSLPSAFAMLTFVGLGVGVLVGALRFVKSAEET
jgi:hypothetical protein